MLAAYDTCGHVILTIALCSRCFIIAPIDFDEPGRLREVT